MYWLTQKSISTFVPRWPSMNAISYGVTRHVITRSTSVFKSQYWTYRCRGLNTAQRRFQSGSCVVNTGRTPAFASSRSVASLEVWTEI